MIMVFPLRRWVVLRPDENYSFTLFFDFQSIAHETKGPEENRELHTSSGNRAVQGVLQKPQLSGPLKNCYSL